MRRRLVVGLAVLGALAVVIVALATANSSRPGDGAQTSGIRPSTAR